MNSAQSTSLQFPGNAKVLLQCIHRRWCCRKWVHFTTMFINLLSLTFICVALSSIGASLSIVLPANADPLVPGWYHGDYYERVNGTTTTANSAGSSKFHCTLDIGLLHSTCTTDYKKDLNTTSVLYLFASDDEKYNFKQVAPSFTIALLC